jgi:hypothetical protein
MPRKPSPIARRPGRPAVIEVRCSKCGKVPKDPAKPGVDFWPFKGKANGYSSQCIECMSHHEPIASKTCPVCGEFFEPAIDGFTRCSTHPDGLASKCKRCASEVRTARYQNDPDYREKQKNSSSDWQSKNKGKRSSRLLRMKRDRWALYLVGCSSRNASTMERAHELNEAFLLDLFEKQGGLCYWYGIPMVPSDRIKDPQNPSIDRLDTSRGYEKDNVVLCTQSANYGRNSYTAEQFAAFVRLLRK